MKVIYFFFTLALIMFSNVSLATGCGHLDLAKCEYPSSDIDDPLANDKYQHFGMIAKGFDGKLSVVYREGEKHEKVEAKIAFSQSNDNGKTWSAPETLSKDNGLNMDYRDPNIGYSGDGTLIVTYVKKDLISKKNFWKFIFSADNGANWSDEIEFRPYQQFDNKAMIPLLSDGLPYGRIVAIPGKGNEVIATGYHSRSGDYRLGNWMGTITKTDGVISIRWDEIGPTASTGASTETQLPYVYAEHSVLPLTQSTWIAASRGPNSIAIFKTLNKGQSWSQVGELPDNDGFPDVNVYDELVAPMLDVMHVDGKMYVVLLYTQRPCQTNSAEAIAGFNACSVLRIGQGIEQFLVNQTEDITWSDRVGISLFENSLSGYQSGVFLNNDIDKYFHLEFHEKSSTDADLQTRIIDLKKIFSELTFSQLEPGPNLLIGSHFSTLYGLSHYLNGGNWYDLGNGWNVVPSDAELTVDIDDSDNTGTQSSPAGHPSHLRLTVEPGLGITNEYLGINQKINDRYLELESAGVGHVSFYAKTNTSKTLKIYSHLSALNSSGQAIEKVLNVENFTINDIWTKYDRCFSMPEDFSGSSTTDMRFTIGYQSLQQSDLENDLIIDNVLLTLDDLCP